MSMQSLWKRLDTWMRRTPAEPKDPRHDRLARGVAEDLLGRPLDEIRQRRRQVLGEQS